MHNPVSLTQSQLEVIHLPIESGIFLEGPAGTGKTTSGVGRMLHLLENGVDGLSILILVPQRTLGEPYAQAMRGPGLMAGGAVTILTASGLAQRMVELFWPMVSHAAGFTQPDQLPVFLTLETAQYFMSHLVSPLLDEGLFDSVRIERNRLYSQILDNLNKAAVMGYPHTEIGYRLKSAWVGEPGQARVYDDVQLCARQFRDLCLENNLLDFSLQVEVFWKHLWGLNECRDYLERNYHHLIYDNIEEDTPFAHAIVREWLPKLQSGLLIYDWHAGFRRFLGASPLIGYRLKKVCASQVVFTKPLPASPPIQYLDNDLTRIFSERGWAEPHLELSTGQSAKDSDAIKALVFQAHRFYPQMLDWVSQEIRKLVHEQGVPPEEIVVLSPFLSDALRFSLAGRLERLDIPSRSHRPSRSLRDEPAALCMLTLSALAHPNWGIVPTKFDVTYALLQAIQGMDLVRGQLLTEIVYRTQGGQARLSSFDLIHPEMQERITYRLGQRFEKLRLWLEQSEESEEEFDFFLSHLFGEVLSQSGFGFHQDYQAGEITANLIESVQKFRRAAGVILAKEGRPLGSEYMRMVDDGVIAAQYLRSWRIEQGAAVLLAPAYTFLMRNRPVEVQFWLDVGGRAWAERLFQPLTQPYVMSLEWEPGRQWTDMDELAAEGDALYRLVLGLVRRCRQKIFLGLSSLGEQGYEQRGPLLQVFQRVLRG